VNVFKLMDRLWSTCDGLTWHLVS